MDKETRKILKISILTAIIVYIIAYLARPLIIHYLVPSILRLGISFPWIYARAARGDDNYLLAYAVTFASITGLTMNYIVKLIFGILSKKIRRLKKLHKACIALGIIFAVLYFLLYSYSDYAGHCLRKSFEQKLDIIKPCILKDRDMTELKSLWAAMDNRAYYRIICNKIYEYAQKNNEVKEGYSRFIARHNFEIRLMGENK